MSYLQCHDPYRYLLRSGKYPIPYPYYYPYISPAPNLSNEECGWPSFYGSLPYDCYYNYGPDNFSNQPITCNNLSCIPCDPLNAKYDYCCYDKIPFQDPSNVLGFSVENLISNIPTAARNLDPNLLDPWGIIVFNDILWVANAGSGLITNYDLLGRSLPTVVNVFGPVGNIAQPTGLALNLNPDAFIIRCNQIRAAATFIIATRDGTILGFNASVNAFNSIELINNSANGSVYTGVSVVTLTADKFLKNNRRNTIVINSPNVSNPAFTNVLSNSSIVERVNVVGTPIVESVPGKNNIYAADFYNKRIDVFDGLLNRTECFSFIDENTGDPIPECFAPYNIVSIGDFLYVTYAKQDPLDNQLVETGTGLGYINIFSLDGIFFKRFASRGVLNAPWGMVLVPAGFGYPAGSFMVSNFGDGVINVFDNNGEYISTLRDQTNNIINLGGLRGLAINPNFLRILYWASNDNGISTTNDCLSNGFVGSINTRANI